ncbi:MAG: tryptophan--tRNA ligase, partial [Gammaproteobacteria bacterium]|nr:tryptophan--tRNA ligase [Gammaproteobacteria bacterium]
PIRERAREYLAAPDTVRSIMEEGSRKAREVARETLGEVREAMGLSYS